MIQIILFRLLDVLADRKAKTGLSGHVLINGRRQPHNFKCGSAYVVQVISYVVVCVCACACMCACTCVCQCLCTYVCICVMHTCMYVYVRMYVYVCM